jgi:hypothetical protein
LLLNILQEVVLALHHGSTDVALSSARDGSTTDDRRRLLATEDTPDGTASSSDDTAAVAPQQQQPVCFEMMPCFKYPSLVTRLITNRQ